MRHKIHTPTEQYGFVETEFDAADFLEVGTIDNYLMGQAAQKHNEVVRAVKGGSGLDDKAWRMIFDSYMVGNSITPEQHERMNEYQSRVIHEIDKYVARQKYVNPKGEVHHSMKELTVCACGKEWGHKGEHHIQIG